MCVEMLVDFRLKISITIFVGFHYQLVILFIIFSYLLILYFLCFFHLFTICCFIFLIDFDVCFFTIDHAVFTQFRLQILT